MGNDKTISRAVASGYGELIFLYFNSVQTMEYQEVKNLALDHLVNQGFTRKGKDAVYTIMNDSFILVKPRKHTISSTLFFIDYGIVYKFDNKSKKPTKTSDCHIRGEFSNIVNRKSDQYEAWKLDRFNSLKFFTMIDTIILPYIDNISETSYIVNNYPDNHDSYPANPITIANHEFLCNLKLD